MEAEVHKKNISPERIWAGIIFLLLLLLPLPALIFAHPQDLPLIGGFQCPILHYTGYRCAGCGMTRAMHAFFHGDFAAAFHYNALFALPLLIWLYFLFICGTKAGFDRSPSLKIPAVALPLLLLLLFGFWLFRLMA